jgi:hypothetical protein
MVGCGPSNTAAAARAAAAAVADADMTTLTRKIGASPPSTISHRHSRPPASGGARRVAA